MVQISRHAAEFDHHRVPAYIQVLVMEWLVNITDELESHVNQCPPLRKPPQGRQATHVNEELGRWLAYIYNQDSGSRTFAAMYLSVAPKSGFSNWLVYIRSSISHRTAFPIPVSSLSSSFSSQLCPSNSNSHNSRSLPPHSPSPHNPSST